jgi:tRNA U34 5-carboxymethylaminomethyl modifying GTPase MnmE/TrmE
LADKLREHEASTLQALEPEFSRLRVTAQQDGADVTAKLAEDTRRMKSDLKKLFENKLSSEEKHHRDNQRMFARVRLDEAVVEAEQLEREHKRKLAIRTEELTNALDQFRTNRSQKVSATNK